MNDKSVHRVGEVSFGVTEAISLTTLGVTMNSAASTAKSVARTGAKFIRQNTSNKGSIAKMARDYIMQFPVIASSSIPEEDLVPIVKNFEIQYAQFAAMILQGTAGINVKDIASTSDILKQIHSNEDAPNLLDYAMDISGGRSAKESLQVAIPDTELRALAFGTDSEFTMENLNSMYNPNERMLKKYEKVTAALEGNDPTPSPDTSTEKPKYSDMARDKDETDRKFEMNNARYENIKSQTRMYKQNKAESLGREKKTDMDMAMAKQTKVSSSDLNKIQTIGEAPTVLTATLYLESEAGVPEPRTLVFGVKCMTRAIPSTVMVPNVVECIASNTWAFKFVKWTKGETKFFRDIVFDISNAKKEAINESDPAGAWFNSIKRRKRNSKWFRSKTNISPVMTLILTDAEVELIKAKTGIDLSDDTAAAKLLKDMYLLGFAIYHTANGNVDIMLDKYSNGRFYSTTMTGLRASNRGNTNTDLREINKLLQNGGYIR